MTILCILLVLALVAVTAGFYHRLQIEKRRFKEMEAEREAIEVEEARLFGFLHDLGETTSHESSEDRVRRVITEGAAEVVEAEGAALYLHDPASGQLVPTHCTAECPALTAIPERIVERARENPATLHSFIRLHAVGEGEGLLGHCLAESDSIRVADLVHDSRFEGKTNAHQMGLSAMYCPLIHDRRVFGVLAAGRHRPFTDNDFSVFRSVADQSAYAVANAVTHREAVEKRRLEEELSNASQIQRILLPQKNPELEDYHFAALSEPARHLSGDYYDYVQVDQNHYGIVIGDVSGKGIAASLVTAMCRSVLRAQAPDAMSPGEVLTEVNRVIFPDMKEDMFVSSIYLLLERDSPKVTVARAGHPPILHWKKSSAELVVHEPKGMAMGLDAGNVFSRIIGDMTFEMDSGDCLLLYTDGVLDFADSKGLEYGAKRLRKLFSKHSGDGADALMEALDQDLTRFRNGATLVDDITLIAIEKR